MGTLRGPSAETPLQEWGTTVWWDFVGAMCGDFLGAGVAREVFVLATDETKVIKIEHAARSFQNVEEWGVWHGIEYNFASKWRKWFAPCHYIGPAGAVLVQSRTTPLTTPPKSIPNIFTDTKLDNWGLLDGRPVCHDYGLNLLTHSGLTHTRLRKARFW